MYHTEIVWVAGNDKTHGKGKHQHHNFRGKGVRLFLGVGLGGVTKFSTGHQS